jgi:D-amino-acid dehydrogenase
VEDVARVDGRRLRAALLRAVERRGGLVVRGSAELTADGGVRVSGEAIAADAVVAATGAWSDLLGTPLRTYPQRGQILHLEVPAETARWPVLMGYRDHYLLTFPAHRVVAGATREDDAGFDYRVTAGGLAKVIADAFHYAPGLAAATVVETRIGFRPRSRDGLPVLGALPGREGVYAANGLGEYGLTGGPYAGALVADLVLGRPGPAELELFSPARLSA